MGVWSERGNGVGGEVEVVDVVGCLVVQTNLNVLITPGERVEVLAGSKVGKGDDTVVINTESAEVGAWTEI